MDKNEILARSREENKKQDERDRMIADKAAKLGYSTGLIVCMVLVIVETAITGNANLGSWAVYMAMTTAALWVEYAYKKKKHQLVFGIIGSAVTVLFLTVHILRLLGVMV